MVSIMLLQEPKQALRRQKRRFCDEDSGHDHLPMVKKQCTESQDIPVVPAHCSQPARHPEQPSTRRPRVTKVKDAWNTSTDCACCLWGHTSLVCFPVTAVCRCYDTTDLQIVAEDALHQCGLKAVVANSLVWLTGSWQKTQSMSWCKSGCTHDTGSQ